MPGNVLQDKNKPDNLSVEIGFGGLLNNASLSGNYNKTDQEQINRATVGAGTVIIRSDPARGLEGLNRDIAKARELSKDEKVNVTVYVDSTSLKESASGFEGTLEGVGKLGENLRQVVREWKALTAALLESAKHLGQAGLDAMQAMLRNGASSEQVAQLMNDPEFQRIITGFASISLDGEPVGETYVDGNGRHVVEITRPGDASLLLTQMCRLYEYVEALPYKDEISAALFGVQAVCSGPLGLIKNLLGGEVMDAATQNLATYFVIEGVYKGEEGAKVFPQDQLTSEVKATKFFLDLGLGVGVGALSGSIKPVGKDSSQIAHLSPSELLAAASKPYKEQTMSAAGRAVMKHPEYFGFNSQAELQMAYRTEAERNALGTSFVKEILENGTKTTGAGGRWKEGWVTYTLPDGRAASWTVSGEFIGFRGVQR